MYDWPKIIRCEGHADEAEFWQDIYHDRGIPTGTLQVQLAGHIEGVERISDQVIRNRIELCGLPLKQWGGDRKSKKFRGLNSRGGANHVRGRL